MDPACGGRCWGALGAALGGYYQFHGMPRILGRSLDSMRGAYLGPSFSQAEVETRLIGVGARFAVLSESAIIGRTANALAEGKAVGWMQGRMEFGPRALGNRSILGDPRSPSMQKTLNLKIKYRESFRPFAPSILIDDVREWFSLDCDSPYMLLVASVNAGHRRDMSADERALFGIDKLNVPRSTVPAITHVDYSARIQTVDADTNPRYYALIQKFKELTGCPMVVNTSFNVRGEPIVLSPEDAFRCFMGCELDVLVVGDCFLEKQHQDLALRRDYAATFNPD